jgi:hypothetical protein
MMSEDERKALADQWLMSQGNGLEDYPPTRKAKGAGPICPPALTRRLADFMRLHRRGSDEENLQGQP